MTDDAASTEHAELHETLETHRDFLRRTVDGLTDEQAAATPTASALSLGGLIKHVSRTEHAWISFVLGGAAAMEADSYQAGEWTDGFRMVGGESLAGLLAAYEAVAQRTFDVVSSITDLDESHPLPEAPWFQPGASRSVRRVMLHLIAETAQHAGHADIIRETIDGSKTMG